MAGRVFERYEIKYRVTAEQRAILEQAFLDKMHGDEYGNSTICNIYYDTPDYRLIRTSMQKPVYKEKIRLRSYSKVLETDKTYLELKKKYKGVVHKRRMSLMESQAVAYMRNDIPLPKDTQIGREIDYAKKFYGNLIPAIYLCYDRVAYYGNDDPDFRITFDTNIRWRQDKIDLKEEPGGEQLLENQDSIMEIKVVNAMPMWLVELLSKMEIRKISFSKYGMAYTKICERKKLETKILDGAKV